MKKKTQAKKIKFSELTPSKKLKLVNMGYNPAFPDSESFPAKLRTNPDVLAAVNGIIRRMLKI